MDAAREYARALADGDPDTMADLQRWPGMRAQRRQERRDACLRAMPLCLADRLSPEDLDRLCELRAEELTSGYARA